MKTCNRTRILHPERGTYLSSRAHYRRRLESVRLMRQRYQESLSSANLRQIIPLPVLERMLEHEQALSLGMEYIRLIAAFSGQGDLKQLEDRICADPQLYSALVDFGKEVARWIELSRESEPDNSIAEWFNTKKGQEFVKRLSRLFGIDLATFSPLAKA